MNITLTRDEAEFLRAATEGDASRFNQLAIDWFKQKMTRKYGWEWYVMYDKNRPQISRNPASNAAK